MSVPANCTERESVEQQADGSEMSRIGSRGIM